MEIQRRAKLLIDADGEYIIPERYRKAPVFRADKEYIMEEPTTSVEANSFVGSLPTDASKISILSQSIDDDTLIILGQKLYRNCGACFPLEYGIVIGFIDVPKGQFVRGGVHAVVRWNNREECEKVKLSEIHSQGWRSVNGSPLGVFVIQ